MKREENWLLFFKEESQDEKYFKEMLWIDNKLYYRSGKFRTWGTSEKMEFKSEVEMREKIEELSSDIIKDGFQLVRRWNFTRDFDFKLFEDEVEEAFKKNLNQALISNPEINGIALTTDDSICTIGPVYSCFKSIEDEIDDKLMIVGEWQMWDIQVGFEIPYRLLLSLHREEEIQYDLEEYSTKLREVCMNVIEKTKHLIKKNMDEMVFQVTSTQDVMKVEEFKRINSEKLYKRYKVWRESW